MKDLVVEKQSAGQLLNVLGIILISVFAVMSVINLNRSPSVWWDEGWTLNVARNWVDFGHYGQLNYGELRGPGLSAAFPVVAPIALSFHLFGVGVWQGRLPSVVFLIGSLVLIYYLANRLYNRKIALGALFILLFFSGQGYYHPLTSGRTAMGEMPMLFYLLGGYCLLLLALERSIWFILPASLLWGIGLFAKGQPLPFWMASLFIPLILSLYLHRKREAVTLLGSIIFTFIIFISIRYLIKTFIIGYYEGLNILDLIKLVAFVLDPTLRFLAILMTTIIGIPTIFGLIYESRKSYHSISHKEKPSGKFIVIAALLSFVGVWFIWYIFLAMYFDRYLFPALFVGSIFSSVFIYQNTHQFNLKLTFKSASSIFLPSRNRRNFVALFLIIYFVILLLLTLSYLSSFYLNPGVSIKDVTRYLEDITNEEDLIESYESELFFLLDRTYHYPPDELSLRFLDKESYGPTKHYEYEPLSFDPDVIVIGRLGKISKIYGDIQLSEEYELIKSFSDYQIFTRKK